VVDYRSDNLAAVSRSVPSGGALDFVRLRFVDPTEERAFRRAFFVSSLPIARVSYLLGMLLVGLFAFLDLFVVGEPIAVVYFIRFAIVCPTLFALYLLTYTRLFAHAMQGLTMAAMLTVGLGVVVMTAVIEAPANYLYYAGILDTVIYACCIMRLRFHYAVAVSVLLFAAYQLAALAINPIPTAILVSNSFFLATAVGVGAFAAYVQEYYLRLSFHSEALLRAERDRSRELMLQAQEASRAKSEFLAMVSHELRTPLNAVLGFSEMMTREIFGPLGDHRYGGYADDIHRSGEHLLGIINDILDLSKAEAGRLEVHAERCSLRAVVDSVVRLMREKTRQKRLAVAVRIDERLPTLYADRTMLTRITLNLLSNAEKFTEPGGRIDITGLVEPDGHVVMRVTDTGIGIAAGDLERVMEPFRQADSALSRKHEGTGLGLPLSRAMAELHGGTLVLESQLGVGTSAVLRLPPAVLGREDIPSAAAQ
jgi:signal transduction histidine kinase